MHSFVGSKSNFVEQPNEVVLQGYHKKLKTMKKKYFVLCGETPSRAARLEYYDSEKKFKSRSNPKKTIILKNCFNINRRLDTKYKHVIALSVRDGGFCIVLDTEEELNKWLKALLTLQRGEDTESDMPKPTFEHVWQVQVQRKGLAEDKGLLGSYHVCLTSKSLTLYRIGSPRTNQGEVRLYCVEFDLTTIRRCGDSQCYFYMEVGRHSSIGAGELWMETEDTLIAQNMHTMIINAMSSMRGREDALGPMRKRSSSETSKPTSGIQRRQTTAGIKTINSSPHTNSTLGRDRCDSLPSRNRTISECSNQSITNPSMPPPKTIPINRPHSMYTNRHSHSPPVNAISPSTGCSESDGSISMDEPDSLDQSSLTPDESGNFVSHYFNAISSRVTIPEEKDEIWYPDNKITSSDTELPFIDKLNNHGGLSLPLSTNQLIRKGSPAMNSHTGSIDMQPQYMDMYSPYSPCGSSPCDQIGGGYIPISPSVECNRGLYTGSSGGHSRASSLAEETVDGYVPMCPPNQSTQEYVDMEQSIKQNINNPSGFSSAASSSSITSGTPSTDLKFAEYPLEKVSSRFTPDDEDMQSISDRPTRAYSVGSRVEHNKRKLRIEFNNELQNNSRVRAFSVGSRAKVPRCDLSRGVLQNNLFSNHMNATNSNPNNNIELTFNSSVKQRSSKSSSAPLLLHKNHSSVERMSDLMEIDFSKNSADSSSSSGSRRNLDMSSSFLTNSTKASRISSIPVSVPFSNSTKSSSYNKATPPGYLEMRPGSFPDNNCFSSSSPLSLSKFETSGVGSNSSLNHSSNGNCGYLEMKPVHVSKNSSLSSSPSKSILSPKFSAKPQQTQSYPISAKEYTSMDMNNCNNNKISMQNDYINVSPASTEFSSNISTIKENEKLMDVEYPTTPEGYVPMNRNRTQSEMKSDNESNQFWINRSTSMPIDIKNSNQPKHKYSVDLDTSAIMTGQHDIHSEHSQPHHDLGISDLSSCNQNTMFSLSPCSPQKTFDLNQTTNSNTMINNSNNAIERKCLVDASNGTVTLLDNRPEKTKTNDKSNNSISTLSSLKKLHISNTNSNNKSHFFKADNSIKNVESFLCNYTDMSLNICEKPQPNELRKEKIIPTTSLGTNLEQHDYVNFLPNTTIKCKEQKTTMDNSNVTGNSISGGSNNINSGNNLKIDKSLIGCNSSSSTKKFPIRDKSSIGAFEGFKPINDEMNNNNSNTNVNCNNNNNNNVLKKLPRAPMLGFKNIQMPNCPAYELLRCDSSTIQQQQNKFSSRPSSVNSDKISPLKNTTTSNGQIRPNSANSECIPSSISNSSSTSTLCGGSSSTSSSSTLCGSKSQSPLISSSRPQSFTDCTTFDIMRADSTSSADTLSSTTSTTTTNIAAVGSSNNIITSRPPSVVSEKELHYASLDLPQTTPNPTTTSASSSSIPETKVNSSTSGDSSTSPSPNASCCQQQPAFAYAQIDFKKSSSGGSNDSSNSNGGITSGIKTDQNSNNN